MKKNYIQKYKDEMAEGLIIQGRAEAALRE
jgi:hypothetical protein